MLAFFWAPTATIGLVGGEVQYDFPQKIFYLHVPIALAAYLCFAAGAWNGLLYLLKEREDYDMRSYVGVHSGMVFGTLVLLTGSIWAKAAWGVWWQWGDRQLLVFLTLYLFYGAYFVLRFSLDAGRAPRPGERRVLACSASRSCRCRSWRSASPTRSSTRSCITSRRATD